MRRRPYKIVHVYYKFDAISYNKKMQRKEKTRAKAAKLSNSVSVPTQNGLCWLLNDTWISINLILVFDLPIFMNKLWMGDIEHIKVEVSNLGF